ncbi:MAG TPA: DUF4136 domain-containing protein [Puia sp.]|nr:DUF4136 domain-containing protein [Puia sp.]
MKKSNLPGMALSALLFFWVACEPSLKVTSDYDKGVSFTQYKTFRMVQLDMQHQSISQLNQTRIINAVKSEMTKKGFQEATAPDLEVNAVIILQDKKSVTANTNYYGYGGYYRPYAWGGGMGSAYTTYDVQNYKDGSLIIDIVDAKTQKLVWEGIGNKEIDKPASDPDKAISAAVASIMASFPPGAATQKK